MKSWNKGFTLVELMIVISVISVLIVAISPYAHRLYRKYQLSNGTNDIFQALQTGSSEASKRIMVASVTFNTANKSWQVFVEQPGSENGRYEAAAGEEILSSGRLPGSLQIHNVTFNGNVNSDGEAFTKFNEQGFPLELRTGTPIFYDGQIDLRVEVSANNYLYSRINLGIGGYMNITNSGDGVSYYE